LQVVDGAGLVFRRLVRLFVAVAGADAVGALLLGVDRVLEAGGGVLPG
jgi:hypothetical protein